MRVKLTDICSPKQWKTLPTSELLEEGYPVYGANGIIGYYNEYNHENPVVAITCRGATCGTINITVPMAYVTGNAMCLDNVRSDVLQEYLYYCLLHYDFNNVISGSAQPQITRQGLEKVEIELCSVEGQQKIIEVLRKTKTVIDARQQELQKLDELVKARFVEMFGNKGYPVLKWNDVFNTTTGKLDSNAMVENGQYPFFTCAKEVFAIDKYAFDQEALLLAGNNAAGKYDVKYYNGKFNAYQRTYVLGLKNDWSYRLFQYQLEDKLGYLQQQSLGGLTKYLTLKILGELEFIIPPIELQNEFADSVQQVDKSKFVVQQALDKAQTLFDSLMQKYFG